MKLPPITPAAYSDVLMPVLAEEIRAADLPAGAALIDPFAGLGHKLATICQTLGVSFVGVEIEPGYFEAEETHPNVICGDSTDLRTALGFALGIDAPSFDIACTSCAYPNGISDNFRSKDLSRRHTYVHRLRQWCGPDYELHPNNAGGTNPRRSPEALERFYDIHRQVWAQVYMVLKPGARFIVNTKDPMRIPFRMHTEEQLKAAGFEMLYHRQVEVKGLNHGRNHEAKYGFEDITVVRKPCLTSH